MEKDPGCRNLAQKRHSLNLLPSPQKKPRLSTASSASICIKPLGLPLISKTTQLPCKSLHLDPDKAYTIGRSHSCCDFLFDDKKVSKTHCQIVFDSYSKRVLLSDGRLLRASLNGVFVNEVRIGEGEIVGLCAGDEVLLACGNGSVCDGENHVGFFVERIVFLEEVVGRNVCCQKFDVKAAFLLSMCRDILCSNDPISFIKKCAVFSDDVTGGKRVRTWEKGLFRLLSAKDSLAKKEALQDDNLVFCEGLAVDAQKKGTVAPETVAGSRFCNVDGSAEEPVDISCLQNDNVVCLSSKPKACSTESHRKDCIVCEEGDNDDDKGSYVPPPGRRFYLNRLRDMDHSTTKPCDVVSLPELFYPVKSLMRVFIATFTSDIPWFLSYCGIPTHLPVTIACHNAEKCWSSNPDKRTSSPYSDFQQLVTVHPPFPEVIAFGKDRKKSGIACHHPKLFVLQREDSIRVVITSANLVERQWLSVTNTVWWQDFPRSTEPDYLPLFMQSSFGENDQKLKSDFAAQLGGFIASLIVDVPSQAHWVPELAKYCFEGALVHLVASVPGIYSPRSPYISDSKHHLCGNQKMGTSSVNLLGSVQTCVVGLSHLFHSKADSKGIKLKKLARFLRNCYENVHGMSEIILRRETKISADANAVSVLIPNPEEISVEDCIQIGFLPRDIARWVAPLSDDGFFAFSAYICPKDVLRAALEGSSSKVELIIYVSQGPFFSRISDSMTSPHVSAFSSLVASVQRCVGLWRLHEILGTYKWPEHLETDFCFGSSSIGAVNSKFLAAFSAAAGKRTVELSESEESDPYWGGWSASQELKKPSIKIIFPTIERVKSATRGILASRCLLCFSQKTWQRLKNVGILYDAIPYPSDRVGHPMHVKVARRRFQSKRNGTSFGWVYCGSHNFSAAAWGRPLPQAADGNNSMNTRSTILGSRLHVCNYEIGIIFIVPPSQSQVSGDEKLGSLDDITLPYVTPAPKYRAGDRAATAKAMGEAMRELSTAQIEIDESVAMTGECPDEEEEDEIAETADNLVAEEKEEERAYAEKLWSHARVTT